VNAERIHLCNIVNKTLSLYAGHSDTLMTLRQSESFARRP